MAGDSLGVVQVLRPLRMNSRELSPGVRLLARSASDGWYVLFNGQEIYVKGGYVDALGSPAVIAYEEKASARDEEYQIAPDKK